MKLKWFIRLSAIFALTAATAGNAFAFRDRTTEVDASFVQSLLAGIYPGLTMQGMLTIQNVEQNGRDRDPVYVYFKPCIPGFPKVSNSVVQHTGESPIASIGAGDRDRIYCDGIYGEVGVRDPQFLRIELRRSTKQAFTEFFAIGTFVRAKIAPIEEELAVHPNWQEAGVEEVLRKAGAKFPHSARAEFMRTIPLKAIKAYTGCQLDPNSASFIDRATETTPEGAKAEVRWQVQGHRRKVPCSASFEPVEGKLLEIH